MQAVTGWLAVVFRKPLNNAHGITSFTSSFSFKVFPSQDPLDRADFNAVEYINTLFPTEQVQTHTFRRTGDMHSDVFIMVGYTELLHVTQVDWQVLTLISYG